MIKTSMSIFDQIKTKRFLMILLLVLFVVITDQITKYIALQNLTSEVLSYWNDTLRLQHSENAGAFLSLGSELNPSARFWIFTVGGSVLTFFAIVLLAKKSEPSIFNTLSFTLIVAGGIGNLIDRAMKGTVTDFMNIGIGSLRTGIFNVADMAIMAGVGILLVTSFKKQDQSK